MVLLVFVSTRVLSFRSRLLAGVGQSREADSSDDSRRSTGWQEVPVCQVPVRHHDYLRCRSFHVS